MKKIIIQLIAILFISLPFQTETEIVMAVSKEEKGNYSLKDEIVYGSLYADGSGEELYIVNIYDVKKPGIITDKGKYSSVKNLTDLSEITYEKDTLSFAAEKGKFYLQGNMAEVNLPWNFKINYYLNNKPIEAAELAGATGEIKIEIEVAKNEKGKTTFFENYLLQISLQVNGETFTDLNADDGMIANAGKKKQITFSLLPEQEKTFTLTGETDSFELDGIEISAVPSTMNIDGPDTDELTDEMTSLTDAIGKLNDGVATLQDGVNELDDGMGELVSGSAQYKQGIEKLSQSSGELRAGSSEINDVFITIEESLEILDSIDLSELEDFQTVTEMLMDDLEDFAEALASVNNRFSKAYQSLEKAVAKIPDDELSEKDLAKLAESDADQEVISKLITTYYAAQGVKVAFNEAEEVLTEINDTLRATSTELTAAVKELREIFTEISFTEIDLPADFSEVRSGLSEMTKQYQQFHNGLVTYTTGVDELAVSYQELHKGIQATKGGTAELTDGVNELQNGTRKLYNATKDLPEQMTKEIDEMIASYDKSDFDVISFVSEKNKKIGTVQFVLTTAAIELDETDDDAIDEEEKLGFWAKLKQLFLGK